MRDARTGQVEAVRLAKAIDVLHLVCAKRCHRLLTSAFRRRKECFWRFQADARRWLDEAEDCAGQQRVCERALAVQSAPNRLVNAFVQGREVQARGHVEMLDALRD